MAVRVPSPLYIHALSPPHMHAIVASMCMHAGWGSYRLCPSIANYGLLSHVMSSDESTMPYNSTTRPIRCGVQWQGPIFQSRNVSFDYGTHVVRAKDISRSQSTIRDGVSRKQIISSAPWICSAFTECFLRLQHMHLARFLFWRSRLGM